MKKKVLIGFFGLTRTFQKTFDNIIKNLINPNENNYSF